MAAIEKSLNQTRLIGIVCAPVQKVFDSSKNLWTQARLRLDKLGVRPVYVDVVAAGDTAKDMCVLWTLGSKVYVKAHFYNDIYLVGTEKRAKLCIRVDTFKRLAIPKKERFASVINGNFEETFDLLCELHPDNYDKE